MSTSAKSSFSSRILSRFGLSVLPKDELSRLQAFLQAVPGEYCAWSGNNVLVSDGMCALMGIEKIDRLADVQDALMPADAASLDSLFDRLGKDGTPFQIEATLTSGEKVLRLSGKCSALEKDHSSQRVCLLWVDDISAYAYEREQNKLKQLELEKDERSLWEILDVLPFPLWKRNDDLSMRWCNRSYAETLNSTPSEVVAQQIELSLTAGAKKKGGVSATKSSDILRNLAKAAKTDQERKTYQGHAIVAGKRHLLDICEQPLKNDVCQIGWADDQTPQENLRREIARLEASQKELLEQLGTAVAIFHKDATLGFYNAACMRLWQLDESFLDGTPRLSEIMEKLRDNRRLPEQADFRKFKDSWGAMFTTLLDPHEEMLHLPDNTALRMLVVPHSMGGLTFTFEDVTSHLELESSLNTLIAVQKETLDSLEEGVAVFGPDGRLKLWNPSYIKIWGLHPEDVEDAPHISRLVEKKEKKFDPELWLSMRDILLRNGLEREEREGQIQQKDNVFLDFTTMPLPDGGVMITYMDVTDTVQVETALRDRAAALEAAEKVKTDFLANVSYQLRTPLNTITGFAEMLEQKFFGDLNTKQEEYISGILQSGGRLLNLINDILDLSSIEAGQMQLDMEEVVLADMMGHVATMTEEWARKHSANVEILPVKGTLSISGDRRRLQQVLLNLIRNAIAFSGEGSTITLSAMKIDSEIHLSVKDTGIGIPDEDKERVFAAFEQVKSAEGMARTDRGAGLGLPLVKNIIELHGGRVSIESVPDKGTTVTCIFPV